MHLMSQACAAAASGNKVDLAETLEATLLKIKGAPSSSVDNTERKDTRSPAGRLPPPPMHDIVKEGLDQLNIGLSLQRWARLRQDL